MTASLPPLPYMRRATTTRRLLFGCGLLSLLAAWLGPLPTLAQHSFAAHMAMHMSVVAVAAPLLATGLAGSAADPVPDAPWVFSPMLATVLEFMVVWAWHAPLLHHAARDAVAMRVLEQGSFLAVGLLLWLAAFGGGAQQPRERIAAGIAGLLLTSMHMTLLGVLLAGATRPLYLHGGATHDAMPMVETIALQDQQLGGVLMLAVGGVAYLGGALVLLGRLLRERGEGARDA
jgi:putative membrane protein